MLNPLTFAFLSEHPAEAARILEHEEPSRLAAFIALVPAEIAAKVLRQVVPALAAAALSRLEPQAGSAIVAALPVHVSGALLRRLEKGKRAPLLQGLPKHLVLPLTRRLRFPNRTAGAVADSSALAVTAEVSVEHVLSLAHRTPEALRKYVYVLDDRHRLIGTVDARRCFLSPPETGMGSLVEPHPITVRAEASLADLEHHPAWERFALLPVVDRGRTYVGVLTRRTTLQAIAEQGAEPPHGGLGETAASLVDLYWEASTSMFMGRAR